MRLKVAEIVNNGKYCIYDIGSSFVVEYEYKFCPDRYYVETVRKEIGIFPSLSAALYNVYLSIRMGSRYYD